MIRTAAVMLSAMLVFCLSTTAHAKRGQSANYYEVDGALSFATGPGSYDAGFGFNVGAGYMLTNVNKNLQGRIDISYYEFKYSYWSGGASTDFSYTRLPFIVSGRYYFPIRDNLRVFAQAGIETSMDHSDYYANGRKQTSSEVNVGLTPGGGIEFLVNKDLGIFAVGCAHLVTDSYFSMQFGVASHF